MIHYGFEGMLLNPILIFDFYDDGDLEKSPLSLTIILAALRNFVLNIIVSKSRKCAL